jgi:hypothetical protein
MASIRITGIRLRSNGRFCHDSRSSTTASVILEIVSLEISVP